METIQAITVNGTTGMREFCQVQAPQFPHTNPTAAERIGVLLQQLQSTDYVACKIAEGAADKADYAALLTQRQAWRAEIRALQAKQTV